MTGMELLCLLSGGLIAFAVGESVAHSRKLKKIPTRMHVAGTRGKSSVTRLIAAGFREAGVKTAAKTTGTLARMILPDGREFPVFRPSGANIIEQKRIISAAAEIGVEALILECMALLPELHWVSEARMIQATHGIITNVRADHLEVMGPQEEDVALTLGGMVPQNGVLYTAEQKHLQILQEIAGDRNTKLVAVTQKDIDSISSEELAGFSYLEHAENVALSLKVLEDFGIARKTALVGMWKAAPDIGALTEFYLDFFGRRIVFVNGFAANDPESTETIWNLAIAKHPEVERTVAVFNLRNDRPVRTLQLARETSFWHQAHRVVLIGGGAYSFARHSTRAGFDAARLVYSEQERVEEVFESILEVCAKNTLIVGMGNIGGLGLDLVRYFRNRSEIWSENGC